MAGMKLFLVFFLWGVLFHFSESFTRQSCDRVLEKSGKVSYWAKFGYWHRCWNISVSTNEFIRLQTTILDTEFTCEEYNITIRVAGSNDVYTYCKSQFPKYPITAFNNVTIDYIVIPTTLAMKNFTIEYSIKTRECLYNSSFECDEYSCVPEDKVCDGVKDCENGKDEERCKCDCGLHGTCKFVGDYKMCDCEQGFVEKYGTCKECDCGLHGTCRFVGDYKMCDCEHGFVEKYRTCIACDCGNKGTCSFQNHQKICNCAKGFLEKEGKCVECECGPNGTCRFVKDRKKCDCKQGFMEKDGTCKAICGKGTCAYGKCQVTEDDFVCRCYEGFTGYRCDEKIKTISDKQDVWKILQVSMIFATFVLLCVVLCTMTLVLRKMSKK